MVELQGVAKVVPLKSLLCAGKAKGCLPWSTKFKFVVVFEQLGTSEAHDDIKRCKNSSYKAEGSVRSILPSTALEWISNYQIRDNLGGKQLSFQITRSYYMVLGKAQICLHERAKRNPERLTGRSQSHPGKYLHQGPVGREEEERKRKIGVVGRV